MTNALVVVDVQKDFVEGGSLAVAGGQHVADILATSLIPVYNKLEFLTLYTKDWHIDPGAHFSDTPDYIDSWPRHCVAQSHGADFAAEFEPVVFGERVFYKGQYAAAYSGAEGKNTHGDTLIDTLQYFGIDTVDVVGIAYDYCVAATALDLLAAGYKVNIVKDFTASVHPENDDELTAHLREKGITVYDSIEFVNRNAANTQKAGMKGKDPGMKKEKK